MKDLPDFTTTTGQWLAALCDVIDNGDRVSPDNPAGSSVEIINRSHKIDMNYPVLLHADRKLGYKFMAAEAAWILSGDNRVSTIAPYAKQIANFSDDKVFFHGAYGPKIVDQLTYIVDTLNNDVESRRAVLTIWRENPRGTKDTPCTLSMQFFIRDSKLQTVVNMRSNDLWLGLPYDQFNFSIVSAAVLILLRKRSNFFSTIDLGTLHINAASSHFYERDREAIDEIIGKPWSEKPIGKLDWRSYTDIDHLVDYLYSAASGEPPETASSWNFLRPLFT